MGGRRQMMWVGSDDSIYRVNTERNLVSERMVADGIRAFLSSEACGRTVQRHLHVAVKTSLKTNSLIPPWAADRVIEAGNVPACKD
jgi:hypothetical protein